MRLNKSVLTVVYLSMNRSVCGVFVNQQLQEVLGWRREVLFIE